MKHEAIAIGQRVRVRIVNPKEYAMGAAESLDGKTGTIERLRSDGKAWLVAFDAPAKPWWTHGGACSGFWHAPEELEALKEGS
jgi:hypothetical protein